MKILFSTTELSFPYLIETCKLLKIRKIKSGIFYEKNNLSVLNQKLYETKKNYNIPLYFSSNQKNVKKKIDFKYLNYLENFILKDRSVYKILSYDRELGRCYIQDIVGYNSKYLIEKDQILIDLVQKAKNIEFILKKLKPEFFCWPTSVSNSSSMLFYSFCRYYKINFITAMTSRFKNYFYFADDLFYSNFRIKKKYLLYKNKKKFSSKTNKLFKEIKYSENLSSDSIYAKKNLNFLRKTNFFHLFNFVKFFFKHLLLSILLKFNFKYNFLVNTKEYVFLQPVLDNWKKYLSIIYLKNKFNYKKLNKKYIYYPLHLLPEYSTQLKGNNFMNQLYLIETLSKNIPIGYELFVKEHPSSIESHARSTTFYKTIEKFPNVKILDFSLPSKKIIKNASLVVVLDGTTAIEAILLGVPVLCMSTFIYNFIGLSIENHEISKLSEDIKNALLIKHKFNKLQRTKKIKRLLESLLEVSYDMTNPEVFYYTKKNYNVFDIKQNQQVASDYANALINRLN